MIAKTFTVLACTLAIGAKGQQYHGILINGPQGTQLYDPFNTPHAQGNLHLGLQAGATTWQGSAVINGQLAYFGGNGERNSNEYAKSFVFENNTNLRFELGTELKNGVGSISVYRDGSMIIYNAATNSTQVATPMPHRGQGYVMTMLNSECVLMCGGTNVSTCWLYVISVNTWTTFPSLPTNNIAYFPMLTLHTRPYVFGGYDDRSLSNTVYTFESNTWSTRTRMDTALYQHRAVVLDGDTALL
ncbi:unnamed protein product [Sphagnum balticum]